MDRPNLEIKKVRNGSCQMCNRANYFNPLTGDSIVDTIFEIRIGCMCNDLCPECMRKVVTAINAELKEN